MRIAIDPHDRSTSYADLRDDERLTEELRSHAIKRARELGAAQVEFWRPPYGDDSTDRMAGFIELARVTPESELRSGAGNGPLHAAGAQKPMPADPDRGATRNPSAGPSA